MDCFYFVSLLIISKYNSKYKINNILLHHFFCDFTAYQFPEEPPPSLEPPPPLELSLLLWLELSLLV